MQKINQTEKLLDEINYLRNRLLAVGTKKGLSHCKTLRISRELDKLLNEYQSNSSSFSSKHTPSRD
ncbi:aspartyl-phosphate phosphatase Spo0E family protein [Pueribacillus sp. YX66]|uniref:aspartyl-phosphate phosphatase Spo0E family protein n=1 Tax=Pueribacillus sp. YX66 TaxID=3229242 RepID=UPI00358D864E